MILREMEINDSNDVSVLSKELGYDVTVEKIKQRFRQVQNKPNYRIIVAELENKVVGFISYEHYEPIYFDSGINVLGLVVKEQYRNKGIGKELLKECENYAKNNDLKYVRVNSGSQRIEAHKFYRKNGYLNEKEQKRFIKTFE
jgi:ribosomal protein S18 acetylase RimI-like enzyme